MTGSTRIESGRHGNDRTQHGRKSELAHEPNYDRLLAIARTLNPDWQTITLSVARDANAPVSAVIDMGTGGQPQKRTQYLLNRDNGTVVKTSAFDQGSLGQRLRAFVRFGHTGEYGGWVGQAVAALASLAACVLVYTGLSLSIRRLAASLKRRRRDIDSVRQAYKEQPVATH